MSIPRPGPPVDRNRWVREAPEDPGMGAVSETTMSHHRHGGGPGPEPEPGAGRRMARRIGRSTGRIVIVLGIVLLIGLASCQARYPMHPERIRKLLHVGIGLTALSFPWLFRDIEPVLGVVGAAMLILFAVRKADFLRRLGTVIDGVVRSSRGDVCFLVAVAALFEIGRASCRERV